MTGAARKVAVDYGTEQAAMAAYLREGERRALALGNRGPIRFTAQGKVHPDILDAYWRVGFYVFEGVLKVALTAPPVDGEANAALLAFLARTLGVSKRQVTLARGATSKTKLIEVEGVDLATGRERLGL